ncbi:NADH-quinone oxidoreductase subunit NuoH [bacterium]|nr:NADH-quinone oxidoreductase subunit NuoH [bacterium]
MKGGLVIFALLNVVPVLVWLERRISAYIQGRVGPNRVGPAGLLQPLADAVKLAFKEEIVPKDADRFLYYMAPVLAFFPAAAAFAFIPFGPEIVRDATPEGATSRIYELVCDLRVQPSTLGVLALLATSSLGVYGIAFGGWASNSKYPLMGAVRGAAQMISYEVAMGLALVAVIATVGSVDLQRFVSDQARPEGLRFLGVDVPFLPNWHVFHQPLAFLIFVCAMFAENNRLPFDLPEAEPELGAGYHAEYTGLKFAMFFMGEYLAMITMSALCVTLFLGGWSGPGLHLVGHAGTLDPAVVGVFEGALGVFWFSVKVMAVLCFYMWVRWTLPRFRYDQLMGLGWKGLIPAGLANLFLTAGAMVL